MRDESSDAENAIAVVPEVTAANAQRASMTGSARTRRRRRSDWRLGGRAVSAWGVRVPLSAVVVGGIAVFAGLLLREVPAPWAPTMALLILWSAMGAVTVYAFMRGRPAALLRFRATDLLWGVSLGVALRLLQGAASSANQRPFPVGDPLVPSAAGTPSVLALGAAGVGGAAFEEFFFRGVLLVAIFELFRRSVGLVAAAATASLASTGLFVLVHAAFEPLALSDGLILFLVGLTCALVVVLTGRIWGAFVVHLTYNVTYVGLALLGVLSS